jgi:hypothetical protein
MESGGAGEAAGQPATSEALQGADISSGAPTAPAAASADLLHREQTDPESSLQPEGRSQVNEEAPGDGGQEGGGGGASGPRHPLYHAFDDLLWFFVAQHRYIMSIKAKAEVRRSGAD